MKQDYIKPTNDIIFKLLFGEVGRENILKDLLEAILNRKIERVILDKQKEILIGEIDKKTGILDIKAELPDKTIINIELQNENYGNIEKRLEYYMCGIYARELSKGKDYTDLHKVIVIGILNFDYFDDIKKYHTVWRMTEKDEKEKELNELELHFIELPKFMRSKIDMDDKLSQWLVFLNHERKELVEMAIKKNLTVDEAIAIYDELAADEALQYKIYLRRKFILDNNNLMRTKVEEGRQEGLQEGKQEGLQEGKQEIIKSMKNSGMSNEEIAKVTKLKLEEIEKI